MLNLFSWSLTTAAVLSLGVGGILVNTSFVKAQMEIQQGENYFSDVPASYWASPFIKALAERDIVKGYPDGTFRPQKAIDRDEFAAVIRKAFSQNKERTIASGSVFDDVPENYWAAPPIEEAYEAGFLNDFSSNEFKPKTAMTKTEAVVALMRGLQWQYDNPTVGGNISQETTYQSRSQGQLAFPLAFTSLMRSLLVINPQAQPAQEAETPSTTAAKTPDMPPQEYLQQYYEDAAQIPADAVPEVAAATQTGIVVNYPQPNYFNPNEPLERGQAAALIYQTLVSQGKLAALEENAPATQYVVQTEE